MRDADADAKEVSAGYRVRIFRIGFLETCCCWSSQVTWIGFFGCWMSEQLKAQLRGWE